MGRLANPATQQRGPCTTRLRGAMELVASHHAFCRSVTWIIQHPRFFKLFGQRLCSVFFNLKPGLWISALQVATAFIRLLLMFSLSHWRNIQTHIIRLYNLWQRQNKVGFAVLYRRTSPTYTDTHTYYRHPCKLGLIRLRKVSSNSPWRIASHNL